MLLIGIHGCLNNIGQAILFYQEIYTEYLIGLETAIWPRYRPFYFP